MLEITIPEQEFFNEETCEFIQTKSYTIKLEHSLVSVSKWESKHCKPFLDEDVDMTFDEMVDYIKCMTLTQNIPDEAYSYLTDENYRQINEYIDHPATATTIIERRAVLKTKKPVRKPKKVTSEVIYHRMICYGIPFECQKWHLNRLLMLIRVCEAESGSQPKMNQKEVLAYNKQLNDARRKASGSKG